MASATRLNRAVFRQFATQTPSSAKDLITAQVSTTWTRSSGMKRCCDMRLPFKKKKATRFRNLFFPGREDGARVVAQQVVFATHSRDIYFLGRYLRVCLSRACLRGLRRPTEIINQDIDADQEHPQREDE
jgi:hypothetical protein